MNKKITALLTSAAMMFSLSTAAFTSNAEGNVPTAAASSEQEVHHCEMCGAELPEGTLPSPIGVWVCEDCHAQGMGGTTIPRGTTVTTTEVTTCTTTRPGGGEDQHMFSLSIVDENNDPVTASDIKVLVMYEDDSVDVLDYKGLSCWINMYDMGGRVVISEAPSQYIIIDESSADFPADGGSVVLRLGNRTICSTSTAGNTETGVTTTETATTTYPVEGEELGIYVYDSDTNELVGGAKLEIYYDDYSTETFESRSDNPVIHKHDGRMGTITVLSIPSGYELIGSDEYNFIETSQFAMFYLRKKGSVSTTTSTFSQIITTSVISSSVTMTTITTGFTAPKAKFEMPETSVLYPGNSSMECPYTSFMASWVEFSADSPYITFEQPRIELTNGQSGRFKFVTAPDTPEGDVIITATFCNWLTGEISTSEMLLYLRYTSIGGDAVKQVRLTDETVYAVDETGIILSDSGKFIAGSSLARTSLSSLEAGAKINAVFFYTINNDGTKTVSGVNDLCCTADPEDLEALTPSLTGDSNCDGEVNMADAVLVMQAVTNPDKYGIGRVEGINLLGAANCDVDGGGITLSDAMMIQQFKLGIIQKLPENNK